MSYVITYSRTYVGVEVPLVSVKTHLSGGLSALTIAGYNNPHMFSWEHKDTYQGVYHHPVRNDDKQIHKLICGL